MCESVLHKGCTIWHWGRGSLIGADRLRRDNYGKECGIFLREEGRIWTESRVGGTKIEGMLFSYFRGGFRLSF